MQQLHSCLRCTVAGAHLLDQRLEDDGKGSRRDEPSCSAHAHHALIQNERTVPEVVSNVLMHMHVLMHMSCC